MLVFKQQQLDAIQQLKWNSYLNQFLVLVREELSNTVSGLDDIAIKKRIETAYRLAKAFKIRDEPNINVFIYASFSLGEKFYEANDQCKAFLSDPHLSEDQRITLLEQYVDDNLVKQ